MNIWIAGCGDIGQRLARIYRKKNVSVQGIVRSSTSQAACQTLGINTQISDFSKPIELDPEKIIDAQLFYFAPPPSSGKHDTLLARFLDHVGSAPQRIVLISTTGVYGDSDGAWIDETTPTAPAVERAFRRLEAEQQLEKWACQHQKEFVILRVPGIYAEDRLPLERIRKRLPILLESEAPITNRIHADDLAMVCFMAMGTAQKRQIFNVTDGNPSSMTEYFNRVADYAGLARPPQISLREAEQVMSAGMLSYLRESRKISNQKLLNELAVTLQYPSLEFALKAFRNQ